MDILYFDEYIAVISKPSGILSEGKVNDKNTAPALISEGLKKRGISVLSVYPVHRLDRETRGLMVYALTVDAAAELSRAISDGKLQKQYTATVHGRPEADTGEFCDLLFYDRRKNKSFPVKRERQGVKKARLSYEVLFYDESTDTSSLKISLFTGRTHQIRVQFASRKMPLVGDRKYGAPKTDGNAYDLTSSMLSFPHPKTGEIIQFKI